jgi:hypothetical protein
MPPRQKILGLLAVVILALIGLGIYLDTGSPDSPPPFVPATPKPTPVAAISPSPPPAPAPAPSSPTPSSTPTVVNEPAPPPEPAAEPEPAAPPTPSPVVASDTDLGVVEFSDGAPVRFPLDGGLIAYITPKVLPDGSLQLKMIVEKNDNPNESLSAPTIISNPGMPVKISVASSNGTLSIALTPTLKGATSP